MSVIVKNMKMPKNCMSCPFPAVGVDAYYCHCPTQDGKEYDFKYADTIPDTCPLVDIPIPHGRLIDATFEENHYASMFLDPTPDVTEQDKHKARTVIDALRMAKTVIEGSET